MADWFMVIITAIYVIATIVICVFNGRSAKAAKEQTKTAKQQIEEMIRQYNESNRPYVSVRFEMIRSGLLCLVIENVGSIPAKDVRIMFNKDFLNNLDVIDRQPLLKEVSEASLFLSSHQKLYVCIGGQSKFNEIAKVVAKIDISYNDKYKEHTEIDLSQYRNMLMYTSELEDISHHLKKLQENQKSYYANHLKKLDNDRPVSVLVHSNDSSKKFEVFKTVCIYSGATTAKIAEIVEISKEDTFGILDELENVDRFIRGVPFGKDNYSVQWYRR
ncbi:hypothetical protein SAMN02910317_02947 [Ruminococcaceae bacterium FB2012]|nr:hypothetical protein SAMN02910317_02947 [Ruminococcaceae bacterium FB2012]